MAPGRFLRRRHGGRCYGFAAALTNRCAAIRLDDREPVDIHGYPSASWTGTTFDPEMITQIQPRVESIPAFTVYEDGSRVFWLSVNLAAFQATRALSRH